MLGDVQQCFEARYCASDDISSLARFPFMQSSFAFAKFIQGCLDLVLQLISCRSHGRQRLLILGHEKAGARCPLGSPGPDAARRRGFSAFVLHRYGNGCAAIILSSLVRAGP